MIDTRDIYLRLLDEQRRSTFPGDLCGEAAVEIERLRAEVHEKNLQYLDVANKLLDAMKLMEHAIPILREHGERILREVRTVGKVQ